MSPCHVVISFCASLIDNVNSAFGTLIPIETDCVIPPDFPFIIIVSVPDATLSATNIVIVVDVAPFDSGIIFDSENDTVKPTTTSSYDNSTGELNPSVDVIVTVTAFESPALICSCVGVIDNTKSPFTGI